MKETGIKTASAFFLAILMGLTFVTPLIAQDTTGTQTEEQAGYRQETQEQDLGTVYVKAIIEKPSVSIIPTRLEPETGEMEMITRSFAKEIKEAPRKLLYMEEEKEVVQKADKKTLIKKRR